MAKNPYIQLYFGDHVKDTRILPLNVRGGWIDILGYMWENTPKGELTCSMDDIARLLSCAKEEAILVIQTLKEKKIFDWEDLPGEKIRMISRKQKRMAILSEIRQKSGKNGGNPTLVKQTGSKKNDENNQVINLDNQNPNQNPEYENEYKDRLKDDVGGVEGEEGERKGFSDLPPPEGPPWPEHASGLPAAMVEIFVKAFPGYPQQADKDFSACLQIAYQIADLHGWGWQSCLNGRMEDVLGKWSEIVGWIGSSSWFRTKSITFLNDKFQDLIQAKNNGRSQETQPGESKLGTSAARLKKASEW